ncbi:competence protein ComK [Bacillus sp. 491mf]|uniref:competence protein ComK n=1 Tax=Bacillus TaxID=1386 RepID=UPI00055601A5|nr:MULTISPECIES: competence protein ComK [unclassified Bacillus (in: firmicutes)]SFC28459.1 competence protein ComK [Bacillus sp. 491mf]
MTGKVERYTPQYIVNSKTIALLPIVLNDKRIVTRVIEENDEFFVYQKPLEIVEQSCRQYGASFGGRKDGTKEYTGFTHKAPIAISPTDYIYFFPTFSYSRKECAWLSHFHIENITKLPHGNILIEFINGQTIKLEVSKNSFENQRNRTAQLRAEFEDRKRKQAATKFLLVNQNEVLELTPAYEKMYLFKKED